MSIKGTKTEQNLLKSFAGESQARSRYTFFASVAKKEGFEQIAGVFMETAEQEKEHAKRFFKFLEGGMVEITASYPAGVIGTTAENLKAAAEGEKVFQRSGGSSGVIGKTDGAFFDRPFHGNRNQHLLIQFLLNEFPDHTADSKTDFGEFNEDIHGVYLQYLAGDDLMLTQILVDVLSRHVVPVQKQDIAGLEDICIPALTEI